LNKKVIFFLSLLVLGIALFALTVFIFSIDGTLGLFLTVFGSFLIIGGIVGSCNCSSVARAFFASIIKTFI